MSSIFIISAKRTPFGTFGGKLRGHTATDLGAIAAKAAIAKAGVDPALIGTSVWGNVAQTSTDAAYISRHIGLRAGLAHASTALTVNRLCGSGFQAAVSAAYELLHGDAGLPGSGLALAGGTESMSQAPLATYGQHIRFGHKLGSETALTDTLWAALTDAHCATPMGVTAENVAAKYGISRAAADEYAVRSQAAWAAAHKSGAFADELTPVALKGKKGVEEAFEMDEHPRPETTAATVAKLAPVFKKDGVVTAAGSSGIADGAAAMVLASEAGVKAHGLAPLARLAGWAVAGVDPSVMGIGPVPAVKALLAKARLSVADIGLVEVNEAFAAQYLAVEKELGLRRDVTNVSGGAVALGHPLGASGARIMAHLAHRLAASGKRWGVGAACIGGGQGIAVLLENVNASA